MTTNEVPQQTESPKPVFTLRPSVINGTILKDLKKTLWRLGPPIGKGNFGEIFLASDKIGFPVTNENAKFVVKIEPHSNGPLFVEIHCLMNTSKKFNDTPIGIPPYIASGSHYFGDTRYRFLVLPRFDIELHALIKNYRVQEACILKLALHTLNALEELHNHGYCHNDIKAQNLMISKCNTTGGLNNISNNNNININNSNSNENNFKTYKKGYYKEKPHTTDSGNSSDQNELNEINGKEKKRLRKRKGRDNSEFVHDLNSFIIDVDELITPTTTATATNSNDSNSLDTYCTPISTLPNKRRRRRAPVIEYSGSNPMRSCRKKEMENRRNCFKNEEPSSMYDEMVKSHYLRPRGRISYSEFFDEDGCSNSNTGDNNNGTSDNFFRTNKAANHIETYVISSDDYEDYDDDDNDSDDDSEEFLPNVSCRRNLTAIATTESRKINNLKSKTLRNKISDITEKRTSSRLTRHQAKLLERSTKLEKINREIKQLNSTKCPDETIIMEDKIFLIDFGLASKFMDNGVHRPFIMDQRRAHDGTLEFTSRDAHLGAHSRRSDLECLGYNLLFWSQGFLPWKEAARQHQQEQVHRAKEYLMTDVCTILKNIYGKDVPKFLGEYLHMIDELTYHERPDYARYRRLFKRAFMQEKKKGKASGEMKLCRHDIRKNSVRIKMEPDNKGTEDLNCTENGWSPKGPKPAITGPFNILRLSTTFESPFQGRVLSENRLSPKNLRSKSTKKKKLSKEQNQGVQEKSPKEFSWTEILSQDPDQIARIRAEKEFEREEQMNLKGNKSTITVRLYEGKPTYAILEMLRKRAPELPHVKNDLKVNRVTNGHETWRMSLNKRSMGKEDVR